MSSPNYLSSNKDSEIMHHGIKGMKWGVRRSKPDTPRQASFKEYAKKLKDKTLSGKQASTSSGQSKQTSPEPKPKNPGERYQGLVDQVRAKGVNSLTDEELSYFNTRTAAMRNVNTAINAGKKETAKDWLVEQSKKAAKDALSQQMSTLAKTAMTQYVGVPASKGIHEHAKTVNAKREERIALQKAARNAKRSKS